MMRSRFSEEKIISILREVAAGLKVGELCGKHGMSDASSSGIFANELMKFRPHQLPYKRRSASSEGFEHPRNAAQFVTPHFFYSHVMAKK